MGKGAGTKAVELGIEWLRVYGKRRVHASVLNRNDRSIKLLEGLGFERLGSTDSNGCVGRGRTDFEESWYEKVFTV